MAIFGRQRIPKRIAKAKQYDAMQTAREWWVVEAPNVAAARAVVALWPRFTILPELNARIINHRKNPH